MPLQPGTRLGPYEIAAAIGAGGMGEVYQARDTALNRDVAIKVMPDALAGDPDRLARFQREAEALAALNHPNIAQVYGLEKSGGTPAIVMELVEGPTLADRISAGPLPLDEALPIARQITDALQAAHERGIIHRDLKPANIKVKDDGTVKVLDFGLAKAMDPPGESSADMANSPTLTARATQMGMILGTAAYMAPEQAKGKPVDKRADVWAFGVVLFEMLTGRRPFDGSDVSEVMAGVITSDPDWGALPATTPRAVERLLHRCLVKQRNDRLHDIGDARLEIDEAATEPNRLSSESPGTDRPPAWQSALPVGVTAAIVAGLVVVLAAWILWPAPSPSPRVTRFYDELPEGQRWRAIDLATYRNLSRREQAGLQHDPGSLPPQDGRAGGPADSGYRRTPDDTVLLARRRMVGLLVKHRPCAEKDSYQRGYPQTIAEAPSGPQGARWGLDDTITYAQPDGIWKVSASAGIPDVLVERAVLGSYYFPQILPDGESVLFVRGVAGIRHVEVQLASGERKPLDVLGERAVYLPSGHLIISRDNVLFAATFDVDALEVVGAAVPIGQGVAAARFDISNSGSLVYVTALSEVTAESQIALIDRTGGVQLLSEPARYLYPRFSPDGMRMAVQRDDGVTSNIFIFDIARRRLEQLTFTGGTVPLWTPDGSHVTFLSGEALWNILSDFTKEPEILSVASPEFGIAGPYSWSPDTSVLFWDGAGGVAQLTPSPDGSAQHGRLLNEPYSEGAANFSPDGKWFSYRTNESSIREVYIQPFPLGSGPKRKITEGGGRVPVWSKSGELFYGHDGRLWAVEIVTDPTLSWGNAVPLFETPWEMAVGPFVNYDVTSDGRRFVVLQPTGVEPEGRLPARQSLWS